MTKLVSFVVFMAMVALPLAMAQDDMSKCLSTLESCEEFIISENATPTTTCCKPLKAELQTDLACVCGIISTLEMTPTLNLNVTNALALPMRCGFEFDIISECQALILGPSMAPSPSFSMSPVMDVLAASPTVAQGPKPSNAPGKIASMGSVICSFLLLATLMLF